MLRIWALALAFFVSMVVILFAGPLGGTQTLLTAGVPVGAGIAVAVMGGGGFIARGVWLVVGALLGALGYVAGAMLMPDTAVGLVIGGTIPVVLLALATMWSRRQSYFIAGLLGVGSLAGVFATRFNIDPQSLNISLPIALGQTIFPLGVGFIAGMICSLGTDDDSFFDQRAAKKESDDEPPPADEEVEMAEESAETQAGV